VHRSVADLEADIAAFIDAYNENPKPYKWVNSADEILASVKNVLPENTGRNFRFR